MWLGTGRTVCLDNTCLLKRFVEFPFLLMNILMGDMQVFLKLQRSFSNLPTFSVALQYINSCSKTRLDCSCCVSVSSEAEPIVLLSVCQFNELFYDFDPNNRLLWRKAGQVGRRKGERGCEVKGQTLAYWDRLLKSYTDFFFPHLDNLLTLSYAASDCNYFSLLG